MGRFRSILTGWLWIRKEKVWIKKKKFHFRLILPRWGDQIMIPRIYESEYWSNYGYNYESNPNKIIGMIIRIIIPIIPPILPIIGYRPLPLIRYPMIIRVTNWNNNFIVFSLPRNKKNIRALITLFIYIRKFFLSVNSFCNKRYVIIVSLFCRFLYIS